MYQLFSLLANLLIPGTDAKLRFGAYRVCMKLITPMWSDAWTAIWMFVFKLKEHWWSFAVMWALEPYYQMVIRYTL